ncbi:MAG: hypothetical protein IKB08_01645, partial [Clostridia bacterium]|nr:hypothetical protein [Clostridia bacterium]
RKRNKAKPSFTFSAGKYITCSDGTDITRFAETNITARRAIARRAISPTRSVDFIPNGKTAAESDGLSVWMWGVKEKDMGCNI